MGTLFLLLVFLYCISQTSDKKEDDNIVLIKGNLVWDNDVVKFVPDCNGRYTMIQGKPKD